MGLHTCTAVARSLCVSWAFLFNPCNIPHNRFGNTSLSFFIIWYSICHSSFPWPICIYSPGSQLVCYLLLKKNLTVLDWSWCKQPKLDLVGRQSVEKSWCLKTFQGDSWRNLCLVDQLLSEKDWSTDLCCADKSIPRADVSYSFWHISGKLTLPLSLTLPGPEICLAGVLDCKEKLVMRFDAIVWDYVEV